MADMRSPRIGTEFKHVTTGEHVTVVDHLTEHVADADSDTDADAAASDTPSFVVEDEDGSRTEYDHPAQFYDSYVRV